MPCPRCHSLTFAETFYDPQDDMGQLSFEGLRCPVCGEILDPLILENRGTFQSTLVH